MAIRCPICDEIIVLSREDNKLSFGCKRCGYDMNLGESNILKCVKSAVAFSLLVEAYKKEGG